MPTYTYSCKKCGCEFDVFHGISERPKVKCATCGSLRCEKLLGTGAGIIFKGSGFYETDFKDKKGAKPAETAKAETGDSKKSEGASTAKTETKTETKPAKKEAVKAPAKKA